MNTTAKILKAARDLISKPENWTTGGLARNPDGVFVPVSSIDAVCFCALGAIDKVSEDKAYRNWAYERLRDALGDGRRMVSTFNDSASHSEVLDLFSKAIKAAEGEQS